MAKRSKPAKRTPPGRPASRRSRRRPTSASIGASSPIEKAWLAHSANVSQSLEDAASQPRAHITFIHGIANKPAADALLQSWIAILAERGGVDLAAMQVSASMVYWADVLYAEPWVELIDAEEALVAPATWQHELPVAEQVFIESLRGKLQIAEAKSLPELSLAEGLAAGAEERIPLPWFLKQPLMERLLRDVHHYLFNVEFSPRPGETYRVRDEIRRRFVTALSGVTSRPHIVVAHSLGTVIAYDCLKRVAECPPIDTLLTIGSPLGLDEIQDMLRPEWTRRDGFPAKLTNWTNVFDRLDPVCGFDPHLANDFQRNGQKVIEDIHELNSGWFRHPIEKYLRGPLLHSALQREIARGTSERTETDLAAPALHLARRTEPSIRLAPQPLQSHAMPSIEKVARLTQFFRQIAPPDRLESLRAEMPTAAASAIEGFAAPAAPPGPEPTPEAAERAVEKLQAEQPLDEAELLSLEAIVLPRERPVVFIENDTFPMPESPWEHFVQPAIRTNLERAIPAIGRVELPSNPSIPFGGTAFVVGPNLLMTNRHVAELFASGLGQSVMFRTGHDAGWDHRRERSSPANGDTMLDVKRIVMIHPYWDMALLEVAGLLPTQAPLRLSVAPPEELAGRDVAIVGYPAKDWRNDSELQDRIFGRTYNVKRLQPGKIVARESIRSFQNNVLAVTHDSSTLGGNSGSAVIDVQTGEIVGLHFAGLYLKANYAVPTHELARDPRVVNAGVNFSGAVSADPGLDRIWRAIDPREARTTSLTTVTQTQPPVVKRVSPTTTTAAIRVEVGNVSFSVPVQVSVSTPPAGSRESPFAQPLADDLLEGLKQPRIFPRLDRRDGYDSQFLQLDGGTEVPLPKLTAAGKEIVARLDGGSPELKYHKFSIVLHKLRRMALFTAANVDWREQQRKVNGKKPTRKQLNGFTTDASELWATDERIPANQQLPDKFYTLDGGFFQKGHVVRRDDVCWGSSFADMQKANGDTFHTTNCTPQLPGFNMANEGEDNWGDLENLVQAETGAERVVVFAGPVLNDEEDLRFEGVDERGEVHIQIPSQFWKIVVAKGATGPEAFGFVLEQDLADVPLEFAVPARWRRYLRKISDIEKLLFDKAKLDTLEPFDQFNSLRGRRLTNRVRR